MWTYIFLSAGYGLPPGLCGATEICAEEWHDPTYKLQGLLSCFVARKRGPGEDAKDTLWARRMKSCSKAVSMERSSQEIKIWPCIVARNQTELYQKLSLLTISCVALGKLLKPSEAVSS